MVLEWFFRNKNIMIVMIIRYTSKWGVAWPFLHYYLENGQFDHFIRNYIRTSGSMICWSQKYYICNKCNKCFHLRYHLVHLLPIYLFRIMTVRDEKMFLTVSRGLSTDRHQKDPKPLSHSTLSDKSPITNKFNQNSSNGPMRTFLTFCQFPDLPIEFCEKGCPKPLWFDI